MKRKVCKWVTCCALSTALFAGSLLQLQAASAAGGTETVSENATLSGNTAGSEEEMELQENMSAEEDLFAKNPLSLTEEELEYCLNAYGDEELAVWLCGLSRSSCWKSLLVFQKPWIIMARISAGNVGWLQVHILLIICSIIRPLHHAIK